MENTQQYPKEAGVYKLTCRDNGKIYIGKGVSLYTRLGAHKYCQNKSKGRCYFENAIIKHGWDSFSVEILEILKDFDKVRDKTLLFEREAYYIELFDSTNIEVGYNICKYSNDRTGTTQPPFSKEHREKLSKARLGKKRPPFSEEHKEKLRQRAIGRKCSEETRVKLRARRPSEEHKEKIRQSCLGNTHTPETIEKMRRAKLGKRRSEETKKKISDSKKGKVGRKLSQETKDKIRQSHLNRLKNYSTQE